VIVAQQFIAGLPFLDNGASRKGRSTILSVRH
jgi:hypothetical protein